MKRFIIVLLSALLLIPTVLLSVSASSSVKVEIDGRAFTGDIEVRNQTTYVGIRSFAKEMYPSASVTYSSAEKTLNVKTNALTMTCTDGQNYITANGRYIYYSQPIFMKNGTMYAPIMQIYRAFDAGIRWDNSYGGFRLTKGSGGIASGSSFYRSDAVYWLSRIINAEAKGEPLIGKIAVGNVILNRMRSKDFPNTIYGVIFDRKYGVQFTPTSNGTIYATPTEESVIAAKICLEGYTVSTRILYFVNPSISPNNWMSRNREYFGKIGNHAFYY